MPKLFFSNIRLLLASLVAQSLAAPAWAELVTNQPDHGVVRLYYVQGDRVMRTDCDRDTTVYTHDSCRAEPRQASAALFFRELAGRFGTELPRYERQVSESWINLHRVEARLLELVASEPPHNPEPVSWEAIEAKQRELAAIEERVVAVRDQIARLMAELEASTPDPDAVLQLERQRRRLGELLPQQESARAELVALRRRYVDERALAADETFRDLIVMRDGYERELAAARRGVESQTQEIVRGEEAAARIKEQGFTWVSLGTQTLFGASESARAFTVAEIASRTYSTRIDDAVYQVRIEIPRAGLIESLRCRFPVPQRYSCAVVFDAPGDRDVTASLSVTSSREIRFDTATDYYYASLLESRGLYLIPAEGTWEIRVACSMIGPLGPAPTECAITLKP